MMSTVDLDSKLNEEKHKEVVETRQKKLQVVKLEDRDADSFKIPKPKPKRVLDEDTYSEVGLCRQVC